MRRHSVHAMKLAMLLTISVLFLATELEAAPSRPSPMAPWEKCGSLELRVKRDGAGREGARDDDGRSRRELRQLVELRVHPAERLHALELLVLGQHGRGVHVKKRCCRDECKENMRKNTLCEKKCMDPRRDDEVGADGDDRSGDGDGSGDGEPDGSGDGNAEDNKKGCDDLEDTKGWQNTCKKSLKMCTTTKGKTGKKGKREKKCERNAMQFCELVGKKTSAICEKTCCEKGY